MECQSCDFDPVKYGIHWQQVNEMEKKIDKMEKQLDDLVAMANKGRGGLWVGMVMISVISSAVGFMLSHLKIN